jgi:hypothetical protein
MNRCISRRPLVPRNAEMTAAIVKAKQPGRNRTKYPANPAPAKRFIDCRRNKGKIKVTLATHA